MSLENLIEQNTAALNAVTAALNKLIATSTSVPTEATTTARKPKAAEKAPEKPVEAGPTVNDVRAAAQKLLDIQRIDLIRPLLPKYGVEKISAVAPEKYAEVIADLTAALVQAEKEKAGAVV